MAQLPPVYLAPGLPQRTEVLVPSSPLLVGSHAFAQAVIVIPLGEVHLTNGVHALIAR
jgi:hypothetical protein